MSLRVTGSNKKGEAYLILSQGDIEKTINLTGSFDACIDISQFAPGQISLCFVYENAGEVKVDMLLEVENAAPTAVFK